MGCYDFLSVGRHRTRELRKTHWSRNVRKVLSSGSSDSHQRLYARVHADAACARAFFFVVVPIESDHQTPPARALPRHTSESDSFHFFLLMILVVADGVNESSNSNGLLVRGQ